MKIFSKFVRAAIIALGMSARISGQSLRHEPAGYGQIDNTESTEFHVVLKDGEGVTRRLQKRIFDDKRRSDDALDVHGSPIDRANNALQTREYQAYSEFRSSRSTSHNNNGDRSSAASFHKTLPHNDLGEVDPKDFAKLLKCIAEADFRKCEDVPAGHKDGYLINPLGGIAVDMSGPTSSALTVPSAPALNSEDLAAQLAEVYWMSLVRDVPFSQYGNHQDTNAAADNLADMPGFAKMRGVAVDRRGRADPRSQLFRSSAVGVETGPMISQLLVNEFTLDSLTVTPKQSTYVKGNDYMTDYDEWLDIQNGKKPAKPEELDPKKRYIRNARDLARLVYTDTIYTEAFRAAMILLEQGAISRDGFNGPYSRKGRQKGFVNYGNSHVMRLLGSAEVAQRSSWYQKWNVHLFPRPEAVAGTLHNVLHGDLNVGFHVSLLENEELLTRVAKHNAKVNAEKYKVTENSYQSNARVDSGKRNLMQPKPRKNIYLLSQSVKEGSPAHPSYPAGHAVQNGAFATILKPMEYCFVEVKVMMMFNRFPKALVGLKRGRECFKNAIVPDEQGLGHKPYKGECLTYEGEINKLAVNIAFGRTMCGVHYRMDSEEGLRLGEIVAVRLLQQEVMVLPENHPFEFRLMAGEKIRLEPDGSFYIDDKICVGNAFMGAHLC